MAENENTKSGAGDGIPPAAGPAGLPERIAGLQNVVEVGQGAFFTDERFKVYSPYDVISEAIGTDKDGWSVGFFKFRHNGEAVGWIYSDPTTIRESRYFLTRTAGRFR